MSLMFLGFPGWRNWPQGMNEIREPQAAEAQSRLAAVVEGS
jgi:hypothetical protein